MDQYNVTGMSCAACQSRVEKAVSAVDGVESCAVSLLTNSMGVEGVAAPSDIIRAVEAAGYGATLKNNKDNNKKTNYEDELEDRETPLMKKRLIASIILLVPLMYVSMGHMMWNWPIPSFAVGNHIGIGIYEMLLAGIIMVINQKFFINGFKGLIHKSPNMDTLVALGSMASFAWSTYSLFAMSVAVTKGDSSLAMRYMDDLYFESAATILTLITVGKMLEARSKGKTTDALKALMKLAPQSATIIKNDVEVVVSVDEVRTGDKVVIKPGESIPVDGIVIEGTSAVNESALTGESLPIDKKPNDMVSAATINTSGYLVCEATRVGEDTTLSEIIKMVSDAAATKAPIAKVADRVSGIFVPAVMTISAITFIVWLFTGQTIGYSLARAISVLVISCPCALGLATPVAIMVGNGLGAKHGILFKNAVSLEETGKTQIIALDKTGTITTGVMSVTDVIPAEGVEEKELLRMVYTLEEKSEHPISKALCNYAKEREMAVSSTISDFEVVPGSGLKAIIDGDEVIGGNANYIKHSLKEKTSNIWASIDELSSQGKTVVLFERNGSLLGLVAVADTIKADSHDAISQLKNMGIHVVMLTGDNEKTAKAIAQKAGVDEVVAEVKPDGKEAVIKELMSYGKVAMVGDGINDAPALTRANIGIAIGAGTDVAIDAADVVLMKSSLMDAVSAIRVSRATLRNIHQNLFWAFFYNIIGIPLAAGCYIAAFGWTLNPMFGAAAMSLSSFCVVSNALRLNFVNIKASNKDKKVKNSVVGPLLKSNKDKPSTEVNNIAIEMAESEDIRSMKICVKGMMCGHCEAHVKEALEKLEGVTEAVCDHEANLVTITTSTDVAETVIKEAVEAAGYEYAGVIE